MSALAPHIPVLLDEVIHALPITPGAEIVDGTFGAGGYSQAILAGGARVYAFDRDPDALKEGADLAGRSEGALRLYSACFSNMDDVLMADGVMSVDGVVLDIGVSSMQLDRAERGFSFQKDGPLAWVRTACRLPTSSTKLKNLTLPTSSFGMAKSIVHAASRVRLWLRVPSRQLRSSLQSSARPLAISPARRKTPQLARFKPSAFM
jgi:hypothetical protein